MCIISGWTWYTGSSGWMYRLGIEGILGLSRHGDKLRFRPQIPTNWPGFKMMYRYGRSEYHITVKRSETDERRLTLDGELVDNGRLHEVVMRI
jgi:cyclic beta-1,2-glucan synthetase